MLKESWITTWPKGCWMVSIILFESGGDTRSASFPVTVGSLGNIMGFLLDYSPAMVLLSFCKWMCYVCSYMHHPPAFVDL